MKYESELTGGDSGKDKENAILELLPDFDTDFAAKPTHLSCSGGVWLTKTVGDTVYVGNGKKKLQPAGNDFSKKMIAKSLAASLETNGALCSGKVQESWALQQVHPGILVDERFTGWESSTDDTGGKEFKVFTIWGKAWMVVYRPGHDRVGGFFYPNGTKMPWVSKSTDSIPKWLDFDKMITIAEHLGQHKDMFRTDIFVGIPASIRRQLRDSVGAVRMVVSETEIHPTPYGKETNEVFEEGARLWLAGYAVGKYVVVPNSEVPTYYLKNGELPDLAG